MAEGDKRMGEATQLYVGMEYESDPDALSARFGHLGTLSNLLDVAGKVGGRDHQGFAVTWLRMSSPMELIIQAWPVGGAAFILALLKFARDYRARQRILAAEAHRLEIQNQREEDERAARAAVLKALSDYIGEHAEDFTQEAWLRQLTDRSVEALLRLEVTDAAPLEERTLEPPST
jgi:flagellar motor protein MotB